MTATPAGVPGKNKDAGEGRGEEAPRPAPLLWWQICCSMGHIHSVDARGAEAEMLRRELASGIARRGSPA